MSTNESRSKWVSFKLTAEEAARLKALPTAQEIMLSVLTRRLLMEWVAEQEKSR